MTTGYLVMKRPATLADILDKSEFRRRRPIIREGPAIDEVEPDAEAVHTQNLSEGGALAQTPVRRRLNSLRTTFTVRLLKPLQD